MSNTTGLVCDATLSFDAYASQTFLLDPATVKESATRQLIRQTTQLTACLTPLPELTPLLPLSPPQLCPDSPPAPHILKARALLLVEQ